MAGEGTRRLQRQPPSPPAVARGSCSQRGPDTAFTSCAISSGISPLASFPESHPSPAAAPRSRGNRPPGHAGSPARAGRATWALLRQRQPHLARAAPVQLPAPARGPGGRPSGPALLHPLPWDPLDSPPLVTAAVLVTVPPPEAAAPTCRQPRGQRPARGAGWRKAPQICLRREHGAAGIALQQRRQEALARKKQPANRDVSCPQHCAGKQEPGHWPAWPRGSRPRPGFQANTSGARPASTLATNEHMARGRPAAWGLEHRGAGPCQGCREESATELLTLGTRLGTAGTVGNTRGPSSFAITPFSPPRCQEGNGSPSTAVCAALVPG